MARANRIDLAVRRATSEDVPALLSLVEELREAGRASRSLLRGVSGLAERLADLVADDATEVLLAETGTDPVGMAILFESPVTSLTDLPTLRMDYAVVARRARRRGVGRALVAAAAAYAEDAGMEQLAVAVVPADREANRFYARLGFAPVVVRRVSPVAALRRKLAVPERRPTASDLARRRLLRRPGSHRPLPNAARTR